MTAISKISNASPLKMGSSYVEKRRENQSIPLLIFVFLMGFSSAQRFLFPEFSALVCIIVFSLPLVAGFHDRQYLTIFFLSIVSIADLGGLVYSETPSPIKYIIYTSLIAAMIGQSIYKIKMSHRYLFLFSTFIIFNTLIHKNTLDNYTLFRDFFTLLMLLSVSLAVNIRSWKYIDEAYVLYFCIGVLLSELINVMLNYTVLSGEYLNYSSFKLLVVFPIMYFITLKRYFAATVFIPFTLVVLGAYASRMLMITGILLCLLLIINEMRYYFWRTLSLFIGLTVILALALWTIDINLEGYRVFSIFYTIGEFDDISSAALYLDPVRFAENSVFFGQNLFKLLMGNGLGTGIVDETGIFALVPNDGAAFSPTELNESHFFRLHDSWTWIGFRFGLLAYLLFVIWGVKGCLSKDRSTALFAAFMLLVMFNATFSIGGLIACAVLALHYKLKAAAIR